MKIITWNCNMAFRRKTGFIMAQKPDILIIQECECLEKLKFGMDIPIPSDSLWFGTNQHKGLAIFSFGDLKLNVLADHNIALQLIVPVNVAGNGYNFNLFAIWAHNPDDPDGNYVVQVWKAIHHYSHLLSLKDTILTGDFNSNTIWDKNHRNGNHSQVVKYLEEKGIFSTYHLQHEQVQGKEQHPTFYLYKHLDKPYHIDYCFVSENLAKQMIAVEIGNYTDWKQYSDHVPLMVTFNSDDEF